LELVHIEFPELESITVPILCIVGENDDIAINGLEEDMAILLNKADWELWASTQTKKNYCILIFLKDIEKIKPFEISKKGYGMSSAWLVTDEVNMLKISA